MREGERVRKLRRWWLRVRGWWLLVVAGAATAVLSALDQKYSGMVAAALVAAGGAVAAILSDRGREQLAAGAAETGRRGSSLYVCRVSRMTDPIRLGVHPAAALKTSYGNVDRVPPFVERDRWADMTEAVEVGGFVLVVGDSTAGKTRLAYETMRSSLPRHVCVSPETPNAVAAAMAAARENRPSVLWLDDLERYLGVAGLTRGDIDDLLTVSGSRVVVLATLRAQERQRLSRRHDPEREPDERQAVRLGREVLAAVTTEIRLDRSWSDRELAAAAAFAHDIRIAQAIASADRHGVAEHLAAGPELLRELRDAWAMVGRQRTGAPTSGGPRGAALVTAAVDVRRAGHHRPVPLGLLRDLHESYLRAAGGAALRPEPWEDALRWATQPLHATSSLLEPVEDDRFLVFDYLVDAAMRDPATPPVPDATWTALVDQVNAADLVEVGWEACLAGHLDHVRRAMDRAAAQREYLPAAALAECLSDSGWDAEAAQRLEQIIAQATHGGTVPEKDLLRMRASLAWIVGEQVGGHGDPHRSLGIIQHVAEDSAAVLGADHPDTLLARLGLARQLGATGSTSEALDLAADIAARANRTLGPDHHITLNARFEVAIWTRTVRGAHDGAEHLRRLLEHLQALNLPPSDLITTARWNLGGALLDDNNPNAALTYLETAVEESRNAYGHYHSRTLDIRLTHLDAVGETGRPTKAAELAAELEDDCARRLSPTHLTILEARHAKAKWTARAGNPSSAAAQYMALNADITRLLDENHWLAQEVRTTQRSLLQTSDNTET